MFIYVYAVVITLLVVFLSIKLYKMFNLLVKLEDFILQLRDRVERSMQRIQEVDSTGHFEADDEIGWTFNQIRNIYQDINDFFDDEEENEEVNN